MRQETMEVIYGEGKTADQCTGITKTLTDAGVECIMITRCDKRKVSKIIGRFVHARYHEKACIVVTGKTPTPSTNSLVCVVTARTSDVPVAEETAVTTEILGSKVKRIYDVGVSRIHHLLSNTTHPLAGSRPFYL